MKNESSIPAICIAVSRYNDAVTSAMLEAARSMYLARGGSEGQLAVIECGGAFELISIASAAANSGVYAGVLALGCVVRGETDHDRYLAHAIAQSLAEIAVRTGVCTSFGVLTTNTAEQALARAGGEKGDKGSEAMNALLDAVAGASTLASATNAEPGVRYQLSHAAPDKTATAGQGKQ